MTKHHIRILQDTALHAAHTILGVTHDHHHVASNHHLVHHGHAHELVAKGHAEWVGIAPSTAPAPEAHEHVANRHREEHADMLSRHAAEHAALIDRHAEEHKAAIAAFGVTALGATGGI